MKFLLLYHKKHRISFIESGAFYIHSIRLNNRLNKKRIPKLEFSKLRLAGAEGLEPSTNGFGDRYSTN